MDTVTKDTPIVIKLIEIINFWELMKLLMKTIGM